MSGWDAVGARCSGCDDRNRQGETMKLWTSGLLTAASAGALVLAGLSAPATADGGDGHGAQHTNMITVSDRCDPVTFNAILGPGTCAATPGMHVTVADFRAALTTNPARVIATRDAVGWE